MNKFWLVLFAVLLVGSACEKDCEVKDENTIGGIAVSDKFSAIEITNDFRKQRFYWFLNQSSMPNGLLVSLDGGKNYGEVDFEKYQVLGYYAVGNCEVSFQGNVALDDANKWVNYTMEVEECGDCEIRRERMNWVLIPTVPDGYTVQFN